MELQILEANYWEHFKYAKDLALFMQPDSPKRIAIQAEMDAMIEKINQLKNEQEVQKATTGYVPVLGI